MDSSRVLDVLLILSSCGADGDIERSEVAEIEVGLANLLVVLVALVVVVVLVALVSLLNLFPVVGTVVLVLLLLLNLLPTAAFVLLVLPVLLNLFPTVGVVLLIVPLLMNLERVWLLPLYLESLLAWNALLVVPSNRGGVVFGTVANCVCEPLGLLNLDGPLGFALKDC